MPALYVRPIQKAVLGDLIRTNWNVESLRKKWCFCNYHAYKSMSNLKASFVIWVINMTNNDKKRITESWTNVTYSYVNFFVKGL